MRLMICPQATSTFLSKAATLAKLLRATKKLCTRPMDIYSHDGSNGFYFNRAPYVTPKLAEALLSGKLLKNGIYIAAPEAQFLSDQFHLVFVKSRNVPKGSEIVKKQDLRSASTFERLEIAAQNAGQPMPQTYSEIEQNLKAAECSPKLTCSAFIIIEKSVFATPLSDGRLQAGPRNVFYP